MKSLLLQGVLCNLQHFDLFIFQTAPPLLARWVPFIAVAAANCVNIPLTRQR